MNPARRPDHLLDIERLLLETIRRLRPIVDTVRRHDRDLADQLRRAASSVSLNLAEGLASAAGSRRVRLETAYGSLRETRAALRLATAWGYVPDVTDIDEQLDRVGAMLYRLRR